MTCIFCQILAHRLPAEILYEDEDLAVVKDINPAAPIHVLIIPQKHIDSLNSLDVESAEIFTKMVPWPRRWPKNSEPSPATGSC